MKYYCRECEQAFEAEEQRCPTCLKRSSVVSQSGSRSGASADGPTAAMNLFKGPGLLVTIAILVPLMALNSIEWHYGIWFTFVSAMVGFGAGHAVNWWWHRRKGG